jgi:shikimate dehydrogenase
MTIRYAEVIGDPVAHSKSPLIHNFWLGKRGINAEYRACRVLPDGLGQYFAERREDPHWCGCNITIPHKIAALDHVSDPGGVRGTIGAINTVTHGPDGLLFGTNTDAAGFLGPILDVPLAGAPIVLIGSGGAANAILFALAQVGAGPVTILARNALKAAGLLARFGLKGEVKPLGAALPRAALLVNASPLGMKGQPSLDIDLSPLPDDAIVYDIVYAPLETVLLRAARARGLETVDGLEMLVGQAALAFELFFDAPPPQGHDEELRAMLVQ